MTLFIWWQMMKIKLYFLQFLFFFSYNLYIYLFSTFKTLLFVLHLFLLFIYLFIYFFWNPDFLTLCVIHTHPPTSLWKLNSIFTTHSRIPFFFICENPPFVNFCIHLIKIINNQISLNCWWISFFFTRI